MSTPQPAPTAARRAARRYDKRRSQLQQAGQWHPHINADLVRLHIHTLLNAGLTQQRIADAANVPQSTISMVCNRRTGVVSRNMQADAARRILAVTPTTPARLPRPDHAIVDATGTVRRLRALVAVGWPQKLIAERAGLYPTSITRLLPGRPTVRSGTAKAVRQVYDALWDVDPVIAGAGPYDVAHSLALAREGGWPVPMEWDDAQIDRPAATVDDTVLDRAMAGICQECRRRFQLTGDGLVRWHRRDGEQCPGAGQWPAPPGNGPATRRCRGCDRLRPEDEFTPDRRCYDGLSRLCVWCVRPSRRTRPDGGVEVVGGER